MRVLALALALGGCVSVGPAQMALPSALSANARTIAMDGFDGGNAGAYRVGDWSGRYERSVTRSRYFDRYTGFREQVSLDWAPAGASGVRRSASCELFEGRVDALPGVEIVQTPMTYACAVHDAGGSRLGELVLRQPAAEEIRLRSRRTGTFDWQGHEYALASVHEIEGVGVPHGLPLGYTVARGGAPIGALELNGSPTLRAAANLDAQDREALMAAAAMLALLVDPGAL